MSNNGRIFCYAVAFIAFAVAAIVSQTNKSKWTLTLISVGLAALAFVPLWDAVEAN